MSHPIISGTLESCPTTIPEDLFEGAELTYSALTTNHPEAASLVVSASSGDKKNRFWFAMLDHKLTFIRAEWYLADGTTPVDLTADCVRENSEFAADILDALAKQVSDDATLVPPTATGPKNLATATAVLQALKDKDKDKKNEP